MLDLFVEGGYPMWFLLAVALAALAAAGRFAAEPSRARLSLTASLVQTTLLAVFMGTAADVAAVGHGAPDYLAHHPDQTLAAVLLQGLAESMSPAIFGFSCLMLVGVLVSFGRMRSGGELA